MAEAMTDDTLQQLVDSWKRKRLEFSHADSQREMAGRYDFSKLFRAVMNNLFDGRGLMLGIRSQVVYSAIIIGRPAGIITTY